MTSISPSTTRTFTLTFGDCAENHVNMQMLGTRSDVGFTHGDLLLAQQWFTDHKCECELVHLNGYLDNVGVVAEDAYVLIIRSGVGAICNADALWTELSVLQWDSQALMRGRVVHKHARHNLCFADESQEPDYPAGRGRIVALDSVPTLQNIHTALPAIVGTAAANLQIEGNDYYDITKCGIGWHGDGERRKVIGVRCGATIPLVFNWWHQCAPVGRTARFELHHGDMYMCSSKAVGTDWLRRSQYTLRHAAGCDKYLKFKKTVQE